MKGRKYIAVGFVALAALVFAIAAGGVSGATKAKSITVWLQTDAQAANWAPIVAAANAQFQKDTGATANVQYQNMRGEAMSTAVLTADGLEGDRGWGVQDMDTGRILTGRREPSLLLAAATMQDGALVIGDCRRARRGLCRVLA